MACPSFIDDFVLVINNVHLHDNVTQLEVAFTHLDEVLALIGLCFEPNKTELMHFAPKVQEVRCGHKPIHFSTLFSSLLSVSLISQCPMTAVVVIHPTKEWHYLGFYFDPFLSFSSHASCYTNKALKITQNLRIMGHCYGGIDPWLCHQTYYAVCWSVMTYGMLLWY